MTVIERFMKKILKDESCWLWQGAMRKDGYGAVRIDSKLYCSHRASYLLFNGPLSSGQVVRHTCDNKRCVNPAHLISGTQADNMKDRMERGKAGYGEMNSMVKLTDEQIAAIKKDTRRHVEIAPEYGVSASHIGRIRRDQRRTHGSR